MTLTISNGCLDGWIIWQLLATGAALLNFIGFGGPWSPLQVKVCEIFFGAQDETIYDIE